ncbi:MAG: pyrroloquinoline quinone-dependent dehydrogenase, partial [Acidobacteria bacterium]
MKSRRETADPSLRPVITFSSSLNRILPYPVASCRLTVAQGQPVTGNGRLVFSRLELTDSPEARQAMIAILLLQVVLSILLGTPQAKYRDWAVYGGGPESIRYSELDQINRDNVKNLRLAWSHDTKDTFEGSEMQCNPIIINGILYATSPKLRIIALDAVTGNLLWSFDPHEGKEVKSRTRVRGLTHWNGRIYFAARHLLYSLDAKTGKPVSEFGSKGRVDLREGLGRDPETLSVSANTPGIVYKDLLILGSLISEDLPAAPGDIRGYDLRTGKLRWSFHTIPHPGEFGYETWPPDAWKHIGGANNWSGMSLDERRGLVFAGTGSAAFDFYGANRQGDNLFANCILALDASTGRRVWHFQTVRHDVWDRDLPAPPSLVTVRRNGQTIDAVAQITKSGFVFVLERETGKPVFPIEYRDVLSSDVEGEVTARQQPFPLQPPPFARQRFTDDIVTHRTPEARQYVLDKLSKLRNRGPFDPPSVQGTILFPGMDGGGEWGGTAFDPHSGLLYVNSNEMVWVVKLIERTRMTGRMTVRELYVNQCASCHNENLGGTPPEFPSLVGLSKRRSTPQIAAVIKKGAGRMPGFTDLPEDAVDALTDYLVTGDGSEGVTVGEEASPIDLKYRLDGYIRFTDPDGYPAVQPPWGTLTAVDLNKGSIAWQIPLGEIPELAAKGLKTGSENYGGPVVTAGGL